MAVTLIGVNLLTIPLPILVGKLLDIGILNYRSTFMLVLVIMVTAIMYLLFVMKNPHAFHIMAHRETRADRTVGKGVGGR